MANLDLEPIPLVVRVLRRHASPLVASLGSDLMSNGAIVAHPGMTRGVVYECVPADAMAESSTRLIFCLGVRFALGSDLHMPGSEDVSGARE